MSDAIDRDAAEAILRRRVDGCYGDCTTQCLSCAAKEDIEEIRALPAVPPAAERLARALETAVRHLPELRWGTPGGRHPGDPVPDDCPIVCPMCEARNRFGGIGDFRHGDDCPAAMASAALAAYRAASPDSTGAAPSAAEPGVTRTRCTIIQTAPTPLQFDAEEPAVEPAPDLPWGTDIGPSDYMTPAAEPAIFQKPPGSCDEGAVRCNNPEPAAQPFRHGRCCAEEPKEPAPCGTCGGSGNDPYTMTGEDGTKPCATCGGVGIVLDGPITHVTKHCPSCRPGGAA